MKNNSYRSISPKVFMSAAAIVMLSACSNYEGSESGSNNNQTQQGLADFQAKCEQASNALGVSRPAGWEARSHCKSAPPDASVVFPKDKIPTLLIKMSAEEYSKMRDDLEELLGDGGAGGYVGADEDSLSACEGLYENNSCRASLPGGAGYEEGVCLMTGPESLTCVPNSWVSGGGSTSSGDEVGDNRYSGEDRPLPPDPCANSFEGNSCLVGEASGLCVSAGGPLICEIPSFDPGDVSDVDVEAAASFADRKPSYFKADIEFNGVLYTSVGIRYKGNSSLSADAQEKKPLRIKMDEWEDEIPAIDDQRLYGFQALSFAPNQTDSSYLRQVLAASEFRKNGVFAPLSGYVEISLDTGEGPRLLGLYAMTEIPDNPMLDRVFSNHDGNLYKPDGRGAHFLSFIEGSMHKKNNKAEANYDDVIAFINALHADKTSRSVWRENLSKTFDMLGFAEFLAISNAMSNWDTYGGLAHNFYLYRDEATQQLNFIPWDFDLSLDGMTPVDVSLRTFDGTWPLIQAIARDATYATHYLNALQSYVSNRYDSGEINNEIDRLVELIKPAVQREANISGEPDLYDDFVAGADALKKTTVELKDNIQKFLDTQENQSNQPDSYLPSRSRTISSTLKLDPHRSTSKEFFERFRIKKKLVSQAQRSEI